MYCRALMVAVVSRQRSALLVSCTAAFVVVIVVLALFRILNTYSINEFVGEIEVCLHQQDSTKFAH